MTKKGGAERLVWEVAELDRYLYGGSRHGVGDAVAHIDRSEARPAGGGIVAERMPARIEEDALRDALTVREPRRVRRDTTLSVDGETYEIEQGYLAGRVVTVGFCWLDSPRRPWIEVDGQRFPCHVVDPERNAHRARPPRRETHSESTPPVAFDSVALTTPTEETNDDHLF